MNRAMDRIKQAWNENPIAVITVAAFAATAAAKLMDANTARHNAKSWEMEVQRRNMMRK